MKFKGSLVVGAPREKVVRMFADPQYLGEYQDGFVRKEHVSGEKGKDGAVSRMFYRMGNREMELEETIVSNRLPDSFESKYHHKHMDNSMVCHFTSLDADSTEYAYEFEYTRISGFLPKLMARLFPSVYRKQGEKWLYQFKDFVENN